MCDFDKSCLVEVSKHEGKDMQLIRRMTHFSQALLAIQMNVRTIAQWYKQEVIESIDGGKHRRVRNMLNYSFLAKLGNRYRLSQ